MKQLWLLFLLLVEVSAQFGSCEQFQDSPVQCKGLFRGLVWIPPGYTQANISATMVSKGFLALAALPGHCAKVATIVSCSSAFRACGSDGLPLPLCPDECAQYNQICNNILSFDCNEIDPVLGSPLWEAETNRTGIEQSCEMADAVIPEIICPYPFIQNPYQDKCTIKCPPTGIDDKNVNNAIFTIIRVLSPIAVVVELIVIPPLWFQHTTIASNRYIVYWWLCQLVASVCDLIGKWLTWEEYICKDKWTIRTQSSTICALGAIGPYAFRNASVTWIAIITYLVLTKFDGWSTFRLFGDSGLFNNVNESLIFHILAWLPPFIGLIIAFAKGWITANGGAFGCYIFSDAANGWAANILALLPLTIGTAVSSVFMLIITVLIIRTSVKIAIQQWRILFLSIVYTIVVLIVIIFSWVTFHQNDEIKKSITNYLTCVIFTGSADLCPKFNNPVNTNFQIVCVAFSVAVPIIGGVAFINKSTFNFWRTAFSKESLIELTMPTTSMSGISNGI